MEKKRQGNGDVSKIGYFRDIPASLKLSLYNNGLILNIVSKSKGAVRFYLLTILHLERQVALSGIHRNVGLADEDARKQLFGQLVFKFGLNSPL